MTDILILEKARVALQQHHDWHLNQTDEIDIGEWGTMIPANEYCDSELYEQTVRTLDLLEREIGRRIDTAADPAHERNG